MIALPRTAACVVSPGTEPFGCASVPSVAFTATARLLSAKMPGETGATRTGTRSEGKNERSTTTVTIQAVVTALDGDGNRQGF